MFTITKHPDLHWSCELLRWLTPFELLAIHRWPVRQTLSSTCACSFNRDRKHFHFPARRRNQILMQAGNGMDLAVVDLLFHWVCVRMAREAKSMKASAASPLLTEWRTGHEQEDDGEVLAKRRKFGVKLTNEVTSRKHEEDEVCAPKAGATRKLGIRISI